MMYVAPQTTPWTLLVLVLICWKCEFRDYSRLMPRDQHLVHFVRWCFWWLVFESAAQCINRTPCLFFRSECRCACSSKDWVLAPSAPPSTPPAPSGISQGTHRSSPSPEPARPRMPPCFTRVFASHILPCFCCQEGCVQTSLHRPCCSFPCLIKSNLRTRRERHSTRRGSLRAGPAWAGTSLGQALVLVSLRNEHGA